MVVSYLGTFRPFMVRTVYTEQAIIVAGIRRSALVSVSSEFRVANGSANHETYKTKETLRVGPTRVTHARTLFFPPRSANGELDRAVEEEKAQHRIANGYGAPTQSLALREVETKSIDIGGRTAILAWSPTDPSARGAHTRYRRPSVFEVRNTPSSPVPGDVPARDRRTPRRRFRRVASRRAPRVSEDLVWSSGSNGIAFVSVANDGSIRNAKEIPTDLLGRR